MESITLRDHLPRRHHQSNSCESGYIGKLLGAQKACKTLLSYYMFMKMGCRCLVLVRHTRKGIIIIRYVKLRCSLFEWLAYCMVRWNEACELIDVRLMLGEIIINALGLPWMFCSLWSNVLGVTISIKMKSSDLWRFSIYFWQFEFILLMILQKLTRYLKWSWVPKVE